MLIYDYGFNGIKRARGVCQSVFILYGSRFYKNIYNYRIADEFMTVHF